MKTDRKTALHNRLAGEIVGKIVRPVISEGGTAADILVILESVIVGVDLAIVKLGGDEIVIDALMAGVKSRLATLRLTEIKPEGEA